LGAGVNRLDRKGFFATHVEDPMSGHSKWSTIKRKKGAADAKRGKLFTKLIREITIAARQGGGDLDGNPRLRTAVLTARQANMPNDNIDRAVKKGTGELEGVAYEEIVYEGYGPSGVALLIEVTTDNRNRTTSEVRHILTKFGGNLGESGCVGWMFSKKGVLTFDRAGLDVDTLMETALDVGADDVNDGDASVVEVYTDPASFERVREALSGRGFKPAEAAVSMVPQTTVKLEGKPAQSMLKMMEMLEESDDVSNVYANFDISEEDLQQFA
jgi:YebC/PmpR family DNA-binding regulatory protein